MSLREAPGPLFGEFGGRYMPESLIAAIDELTAEYEAAKADPAFQAEFVRLLHSYSAVSSSIAAMRDSGMYRPPNSPNSGPGASRRLMRLPPGMHAGWIRDRW